jgi:hypothetical protein
MASNTHVGASSAGAPHTTYFIGAQSLINIATDGSADIRYTTDGTIAGVASTLIAAGAAREVQVVTVKQTVPCIVSIYSAVAGVVYSICPSSVSLSRPPHPPGSGMMDRYL